MRVVLKQRIWSNFRITFEVRPFAITQPPALLISLTGFTMAEEKVVQDMVQQTWTVPKNKDPHFAQPMNTFQLHNAIRLFMATIRIECIDIKMTGRVLTPRFNILSNNPQSIDPYTWTALCIALTALIYLSIMDGTGSSTCLFLCAICHSYSHLIGLCPFLNVLGWNRPTPQQGPPPG